MSRLHRTISRLREFGARRRVDQEMRDELQSHIDHMTDDLMRRGVARDEARRRALRAFGGVTSTAEAVRDSRGLPMLEHLLIDIRLALRSLSKARAFTVVTVLTLALGIGANTAIFSMVDAVVLRPLPYRDPGSLMSLWETKIGPVGSESDRGTPIAQASTRSSVAPANLLYYQKAPGFTGMAGFAPQALNLTNHGTPERLFGEAVTWNYFELLGAQPALGRALQPQDDTEKAPVVIVLSDALWRRRFSADPSVVGTALTLDGEPTIVVGIMPEDFRGINAVASAAQTVEFWVAARYPAELLANHGDHEINVVARLASRNGQNDAQSALTQVSLALEKEFPEENKNFRAMLTPLNADLSRGASTSLWATFAMVGLILVIACVNVANLLIVRGVSRKREVAIRLALGADRRRVIRELLTESLVIAVIGGAIGLLVSIWTRDLLVSLAPADTPKLDQVAINGRVLGIGAAFTLLTGVVFGMLPAWQASGERPVDALRATERIVAGTAVMRWRNLLMALEVALSAILLVGAGLTLKSLNAMNNVALGFSTDHVLAMNISLPAAKYPTATHRFTFFDTLSDRLSRVPGVQAVAFANRLPLRGSWSSGFAINGVANPPNGLFSSDFQAVSPGYFDVLNIGLRQGRKFERSDTATSQPVAMVSEAFTKLLPAGDTPIGHTIQRGPTAPLITIVGVVGDVRRQGKLATLEPQVYLPAAQTGTYPVSLADVAVRTSQDPSALIPTLRREIWNLDADQPITNVRTLDSVLFQRGAAQRFRALLFSMCAGLALLLSLVGVYGVVSYGVSQRTPEIGVRIALGASRSGILRWLVGRTALLVVGGAVVGLAAARVLSSMLDNLLFNVTTADTATYAIAAVTLTVVAIGAAALAAHRAATIDPVKALRGE